MLSFLIGYMHQLYKDFLCTEPNRTEGLNEHYLIWVNRASQFDKLQKFRVKF